MRIMFPVNEIDYCIDIPEMVLASNERNPSEKD